jgi:hypothetical protein
MNKAERDRLREVTGLYPNGTHVIQCEKCPSGHGAWTLSCESILSLLDTIDRYEEALKFITTVPMGCSCDSSVGFMCCECGINKTAKEALAQASGKE